MLIKNKCKSYKRFSDWIIGSYIPSLQGTEGERLSLFLYKSGVPKAFLKELDSMFYENPFDKTKILNKYTQDHLDNLPKLLRRYSNETGNRPDSIIILNSFGRRERTIGKDILKQK